MPNNKKRKRLIRDLRNKALAKKSKELNTFLADLMIILQLWLIMKKKVEPDGYITIIEK